MAKSAKKGGNALTPLIPKSRADSEHVRVREISNGFVVTRAGVKRGQYYETEKFSPTKPRVTIPNSRGVSK